jgi:hypothetical protein
MTHMVIANMLVFSALLAAQNVISPEPFKIVRNQFNITIAPDIQVHGITLERASSALPQVGAIVQTDLALVQPLLSYGVILVNNGTRRLLQTTVGIKWIDKDNHPHGMVQTINDTLAFHPSQIGPGQSRLFIPHLEGKGELNLELAQPYTTRKPLKASEWAPIISKMTADLAGVRAVAAWIDSVTIEGIGLVGPDSARNRDRGLDVKTLNEKGR